MFDISVNSHLAKCMTWKSLCACANGDKSVISQIRKFARHQPSHSGLNTTGYDLQHATVSKSVKSLNRNQLRVHCCLDIVDMSTNFTFFKVHHLKSAKRYLQRKNRLNFTLQHYINFTLQHYPCMARGVQVFKQI